MLELRSIVYWLAVGFALGYVAHTLAGAGRRRVERRERVTAAFGELGELVADALERGR